MKPARLPDDWFPAALPPNISIGPRSWLYSSFAFLHYRSEQPRGVHIGHDSGLYIGTYFDLGPHGTVVIGSHCTLNGVTFCTDGRVVIGDHVLIAREVVISDDPFGVPSPGVQPALATPTDNEPNRSEILIGDDAWIGTRATLLAGARIGAGAIVGAASVIDFDVPPYAIAAGNPRRIVGWAPPGSTST